MYRERKINGEWETDTLVENDNDEYSSYESGLGYVSRSYLLFALLSNVRALGNLPITPPAENRAWPDDVCKTHTDCNTQWDADAHSHGWLNLEELHKLHEEYKQAVVLYEPGKYDFTYAAGCLEEFIDQIHKGDYFQDVHPEDGRILFFYDN